VAAWPIGDVLLCWRTCASFAEEEKNDPGLSRQAAALADVYVNEMPLAPPTGPCLHRRRGPNTLKPSVAGLLMEKERQYLQAPSHDRSVPGGDRWALQGEQQRRQCSRSLIDKCDKVLIGGGHDASPSTRRAAWRGQKAC